MTTSGTGLDFGDSTFLRENPAACSSPTRMISAGGSDGGSTNYNTIEYITIATLGNSLDFGDLTTARRLGGSASSPTRCVFAGGNKDPLSDENTIDFNQIASSGNSLDFGNLSEDLGFLNNGVCSNGHGGLG